MSHLKLAYLHSKLPRKMLNSGLQNPPEKTDPVLNNHLKLPDHGLKPKLFHQMGQT